ncbi:ankyrin repeat and protein kinase domain-containing protein 1 [Chanos chanos]|uniref:Ankyrin repeat and protein kinase domain-containing protein 1 n=1 Tax=Chanos chanos TaxID=29144 RepID=A0A6J2VS14_CHACN|nr:ankyrin repeat and protein kinase domain-containing protein 1 [Chanos chanos]
MTETNLSGMDSSNNGGLESFKHFKKDDFEAEWDKIAERSSGRVYKVKLKLLREKCVLKTFSTNSLDRIMIKEASQISKVKFKYLLTIYGVCSDPPSVVLEYMSKGSLENLLSSYVLMWPKKFQMIHEVTMGMNFLHSMTPPLLHLNLKPSNILLDDHLHVKISDFGLIKWEDSSSKNSFIEHLTSRGNMNYIPPEAFTQSPDPPTTKYDVYSFSIVMWEILTQKRAYSGLNKAEILIRVSSGKRPHLEKIPDDKPKECEDMIGIMRCCWEQVVSERPAFSDIVKETEVLSEVLKIPDVVRGCESKERPHKLAYTTLSTCLTKETIPKEDASSDDIHSLLSRKDFETFKRVLKKEHISIPCKDNNTLLHYTVASGDTGSVRKVLELGAEVNCQSVKGYTPLIIAVLHKFHEICNLLMEYEADPNLNDLDRWTPLHFAAQNGDDRAVRLLLDNKAEAYVKERDGWTPLHLAAQNGHENVVRILLPRVTGINEQEAQSGRTPLHVACMYGHLNIAKLLLMQGADPNKKDASKATALHLVAEEGHFRVARLLLTKGADVNIVDNRNYSALHFAALRGHSGICRQLLSKGGNPDEKTFQGWTPMHLAALKGHPETVLVLEEHKGSVNSQGENGWTPLHLACHYRQEEVVSVLLTAGADPNLAENNGWTPLHLACSNGSFPNVLQLISHKADVNSQNCSQSTPLHLAAQNGNIPIIKALLLNNARRGIVDSKGCTAFTLAKQCHNKEAVPLLEEDEIMC